MNTDSFIGQEIIKIRGFTDDELMAESWDLGMDQGAAVLELSNGALIYPSCDPEGNGPGFMFCRSETGTLGAISAPPKDQ